ncbi:Uncharacterized protein Adt_34911 [Abeliophyllum distichum]|uniref:Retrotransposon Copia-like N-terminal domain-containing protein n=1 Tax=Abeliophyllum distichum TaxID=126358 RepID=A0ABD1R0G2_9LAMI
MANVNSDGSNTAMQQAQVNSVIPPLLGGNQLPLFGVSLTQTPPVKLDRNNFLLWKNMIMPIIKGYNLEGFLSGKTECPLEFIATQTTGATRETVEMIHNSDYRKWLSID